MKKIFFIATISLFTTFFAAAQSVHFGIKVGANFSSIDHDNDTEYDTKTGFHAGGLAHIHISDHFAVQPEVVFSLQGGENDMLVRQLNYINVPVLAQFMFGNGFRVQTGPQVGFMVSAQDKYDNVKVDRGDFMNTVEFGWTAGAGYLIPNCGLGFDARYNFGISNVYEQDSPEGHNRVFQVGLFYQFMHNNKKRTTSTSN
jgi:hypothetical protein